MTAGDEPAPDGDAGRADAGDEPRSDADAGRADAGAPYAAALAALPGAGPATLAALVAEWTPEEAWNRVRAGRLARPRRGAVATGQLGFDMAQVGALGSPCAGAGSATGEAGPNQSWLEAARRIDPPGWWARHAMHGIGVTWPGHPGYPTALLDDPERPGVLFWRGSLRHLDRLCVAVVGTRRATPDGRSVAFELGRDLAAAGVCVVSGLALGIDGAAHAGAVSVADEAGAAGPAGVAASGVDVPYPRRHAGLWRQIVQTGVMLSETLPGRPAQAWRFPARNRIIAGLAGMVVVVESHAAGGSLITAEAAMARGIEVRVVPGPVRSPASAGSNQLMYDGPGPVRNARDVLDGLGIFLSRPASLSAVPSSTTDVSADLGADPRRVLDAVGWRPASLNQVVERSGLPVAAASRMLDSLEEAGLVGRDGDWWVGRTRGGRTG